MRLALNFFGLQNWNNWANIGSNSNTTHHTLSHTDFEVFIRMETLGKSKVSTKKWPSQGGNLSCDLEGESWNDALLLIQVLKNNKKVDNDWTEELFWNLSWVLSNKYIKIVNIYTSEWEEMVRIRLNPSYSKRIHQREYE